MIHSHAIFVDNSTEALTEHEAEIEVLSLVESEGRQLATQVRLRRSRERPQPWTGVLAYLYGEPQKRPYSRRKATPELAEAAD